MYKDLYGKTLYCDWGASVVPMSPYRQILLSFTDCRSHYFWNTQLKLYRAPNFNMLFQVLQNHFSRKNCLCAQSTVCYMKSALHCLFSKKIKSTGFTPLSQSNQATEAIVSIFLITCVKYTYIWCEHRSQQRQGYLKHLCPQRKMNISSIRFYKNNNLFPSVSTSSQRHSLINSIKLELTDG